MTTVRHIVKIGCLLGATESFARSTFMSHIAYTDANCTQNPMVLKTFELNECQTLYTTSWQKSFVCVTPDCPKEFAPITPPGQKPEDGMLVMTGVNNDTTCTPNISVGTMQLSIQSPQTCRPTDTMPGLYSKYVSQGAPCQPDCKLCQGLYETLQCDYVPSTVPRTPLSRALPGCTSCAASLRDSADCGCASCFAPSDASTPLGCIGGMCANQLVIPCADCMQLYRTNVTACQQCMVQTVDAPQYGGLCNFMLKTSCNPDQCHASISV